MVVTNKNGFVLIETIIVMSVLLIGMIILYSNYNKMIINSSKVNYYDNVEDMYTAYYAYKYVNDLTNWDSDSSYKIINIDDMSDNDNYKGIFKNLKIEKIYFFSKNGFNNIFESTNVDCDKNKNQLLCYDGTTINYLKSIENKNEITKCDDSNKVPCITIVKINRDDHYYFAKYEAYDNNEIKIDDPKDEFDRVKDFICTGKNQIFVAPKTGIYKLEVWGAQGGSYTKGNVTGGYGAYSVGEINLHKGDYLFVVVGGKGTDGSKNKEVLGGYNGGGNGYNNSYFVSGGGGATHIALESGLLNSFEEKQEKVLIVAGGGGGGAYQNSKNYGKGGSGGGINGISATNIVIINKVSSENYLSYGGTQTSGGTYVKESSGKNGFFGLGASCIKDTEKIYCSGGGGGYYGGGSAINAAGGSGGSGYIGNAVLTEKAMYCYGCEESSDKNTYSINTIGESELKDKENCPVGYSEEPISKCAKAGDGFARITY